VTIPVTSASFERTVWSLDNEASAKQNWGPETQLLVIVFDFLSSSRGSMLK